MPVAIKGVKTNIEISQYRDTGLRDLVNHWVIFKATRPPPSGQNELVRLVGFLYADPSKGFLLRVEREVDPAFGQKLPVIYHAIRHPWTLEYHEFKDVTLRRLDDFEREYLQLEDWPLGLSRSYSSRALSRCRGLTALDAFRVEGNPDVLHGWIAVDNVVKGREVLLEIEQEIYDGVFDCRFLSETQEGFEQGQSVCAIFLLVQGQPGLFCIPPYGPASLGPGKES